MVFVLLLFFYLFVGVGVGIDLDLKGKIELQSQNVPHCEFVGTISHHRLKLQFQNLDHKCIHHCLDPY